MVFAECKFTKNRIMADPVLTAELQYPGLQDLYFRL
jgi:hypothetical protein